MLQSKKYAVVFSGGLDSTVLLHDLVHKHGKDQVVAIGIDFGQSKVEEDTNGLSFANNIVEREIMHRVADKLGVTLHMVDMSSIGFVLDFMKERIKKLGGRRGNKSLSLFPGRNFILAFVAAAVAETYGAEEVAMGFPKTDYIEGVGSYTSSLEFLEELNKLAEKSADLTIKFTSPVHHLSKVGEIELGKKLGVDFKNEVWTCLHPKHNANNELIQCGVCKPCVRNRASFMMSTVEDPYEYASDTFQIDQRLYFQLKAAGDNVKILEDAGVVADEYFSR